MLKQAKILTLSALRRAHALRSLAGSRWRGRRLLILGYHGVSLEDEHEWDPGLYLSPADLEARLELLRRERYTVLPLGDAGRMLAERTLPERSVVLTFDDGYFDFRARAWPLLESYSVPATVYLTTYYSRYNRPIFDVACSYVLWKGRGGTLRTSRITGAADGPSFLLASGEERSRAVGWMKQRAHEGRFGAEEKDEFTARVAAAVGVDYAALLEKRILHLLNDSEVKELSGRGVDFELHTHRHRVPRERAAFEREVEDNRSAIAAMTGKRPSHFCYPSGGYAPEFLSWLAGLGIETATTCRPGLASESSHPLLLPRLMDGASLSVVEVESWLSGLARFLPRRPGAGLPPVPQRW